MSQLKLEDLTREDVPPHPPTIEYSDDDNDYLIVDNNIPQSHTRTFNEVDKIIAIASYAKIGDLSAIRSMFETNPPDPTVLRSPMYRHIKPAIRAAAVNNHVEVVQYLMTKDISPSIAQVMDIIEEAALAKSYLVLQLFRSLGWDINQCIRPKHPPVLSKIVVDRDITRWFLEQGALPNIQCRYDITPTSFAVRDAPMNVIESLFEHGASTKTGNLLHYVAWRFKSDAPAVANLILENGADINALKFESDPQAQKALDWTGCGTPLFEAAVAGNAPLFQFLLSKGADVTIPDLQLLTPLQYVKAHLTRESYNAPWCAMATLLMMHAQGHTIYPPKVLTSSHISDGKREIRKVEEDTSDDDKEGGYVAVKLENLSM